MDERVSGHAYPADRRFRLASPTVAVALGVLTLLLAIVDVPLYP